MTTENTFLDNIEICPLDQLLRNAYADWLDENDRPEEANRQRKWIGAYDVLARVAFPYVEEEEVEGTGEPTGVVIGRDYARVMNEVNGWADYVKNHDDIIFGSNWAQDHLHDKDNREEFWEAFEIVTGISPSSRLKNEKRYSCAC